MIMKGKHLSIAQLNPAIDKMVRIFFADLFDDLTKE